MIACVLLLALSLQSGTTAPRRVNPTSTDTTTPIYRELREGESRVEGLLQRVECPANRPVSFVVRVKDQPERFEARTLADVEYIAHTPDFKGPMTCGGRGPGDRVLLTWTAVNKARRVVAIEFLGKK
jgi:hypothetical protein